MMKKTMSRVLKSRLRMISKARLLVFIRKRKDQSWLTRLTVGDRRISHDIVAAPAALQLTRLAIIRYLNEILRPFKNECVLGSDYNAKNKNKLRIYFAL